MASNSTDAGPSGLALFFIDPEILPDNAFGMIQLLFLMATYAYVLFRASGMISDGAELLLLVLSPGLVGGFILPVLGAVPDGMIVLFSGLGPIATVQDQLSVGVGTLAGSTIMVLTLPWAVCAVLGRVDLSADSSRANFHGGLTRKGLIPNLLTTGIQTSGAVRPAALFLAFSALSYLVIQIPASVFAGPEYKVPSDVRGNSVATSEHWYSLVACLLCLGSFLGYSVYSIFSSNAVSRQEAAIIAARKAAVAQKILSIAALLELEAKAERTASGAADSGHGSSLLSDVETSLVGGSASSSSAHSASTSIINSLFAKYDTDGSGTLDAAEVKAMLKSLGLYSAALYTSLMDELHAGVGGKEPKITVHEFEKILRACSAHAPDTIEHAVSSPTFVVNGDSAAAFDAVDEGGEESPEEEVDEEVAGLTPAQIKRKAYSTLAIGVLLVTIFSDPMVDVLSELANRWGVKAFYVSFIITPIISNASEIISSIAQSRKKNKAGLDITYTQLLGAATMNNTFCLAIFLVLIFARKLVWGFSAEVTVIVGVEFLVAILVLTSKNNVQPLWKALCAGLLFPLSLIVVYLLEARGWD